MSDTAQDASAASYAQSRDLSDFGGPLQTVAVASASSDQPLQRVASLQPVWQAPEGGHDHGSSDEARSAQADDAPWYR